MILNLSRIMQLYSIPFFLFFFFFFDSDATSHHIMNNCWQNQNTKPLEMDKYLNISQDDFLLSSAFSPISLFRVFYWLIKNPQMDDKISPAHLVSRRQLLHPFSPGEQIEELALLFQKTSIKTLWIHSMQIVTVPLHRVPERMKNLYS